MQVVRIAAIAIAALGIATTGLVQAQGKAKEREPVIKVLLENDKVRYVLTVHGKPRAVLVGAEPYLSMVLEGKGPSEALVGLQLSALLGSGLASMPLDDLEKALDRNAD